MVRARRVVFPKGELTGTNGKLKITLSSQIKEG